MNEHPPDGDGNLPPDRDAGRRGHQGPSGSGAIEGVFEEYFASQSPTAFDVRSDDDAFITAGIAPRWPFTGPEDAKTAEQVALYSGLSTHEGER